MLQAFSRAPTTPRQPFGSGAIAPARAQCAGLGAWTIVTIRASTTSTATSPWWTSPRRSPSTRWFNQTLTKVNDSVVRLGILEGEYHWHKHDNADECFLVLEGQFLLDVDG